jgi:hypothetical protein
MECGMVGWSVGWLAGWSDACLAWLPAGWQAFASLVWLVCGNRVVRDLARLLPVKRERERERETACSRGDGAAYGCRNNTKTRVVQRIHARAFPPVVF